jgi:hypothetical protein
MAPADIPQVRTPNWGRRIVYLLLVVIIGGLLGYGVWRNNQEEEAKRAEHSRIMQELHERTVELEYETMALKRRQCEANWGSDMLRWAQLRLPVGTLVKREDGKWTRVPVMPKSCTGF